MERRRDGQTNQSPMATLQQLPALVVLERIPVPVLAIGPDATILFANAAFAEMLGHTQQTLTSLKFNQIFHAMRPDESPVSAIRAHADRVIELAHADGSVVRARMSKSALMRDDDSVALATFHDLTEQLWVDER
jgi:PAS domain S-box-containing protein